MIKTKTDLKDYICADYKANIGTDKINKSSILLESFISKRIFLHIDI